MHGFVFKTNPKSLSDIAIQACFVSKERACPVTNSLLVVQYFIQRGPFIRNLAVGMALLWVFDVGVNPTLKYLPVILGFCGFATQSTRQMDICKVYGLAATKCFHGIRKRTEKCGNMTEIEY